MSKATVIRKVFGSGQITLPKSWRDKAKTDVFSIRESGKELRIIPLRQPRERVIFDSAKAGYPEGVEIKTFLKALKKANRSG